MRYGIVLPGGTARVQVELAVLAEEHGWDGVFVWEAAYGVDAWTLLGAMAIRTTRVRLGTMLTPLPWRRPWKVASQAATLDQLSNGRAIVTVGLGALGTDLPDTGEVTDLRARAELLDEGIDLIRAVWSGSRTYAGRHFRYDCERDDLSAVGQPVQARIPVWVVGAWPRPRSMRRVLRCDGVVPQFESDDALLLPDRLRDLRRWLTEHGASAHVDVIVDGETPGTDVAAAAATVGPLADAGATWWLETRWEMPHHSRERMDEVSDRLRAGPPSGGC